MSHTYVEEQPASFQAACATCGWHTLMLESKKRAEVFAAQHELACPNKPPPRSGALMECGCWWFAAPMSSAGRTKETCPLHGVVVMSQANVDAPSPDPGGHWIAQESASSRLEGERE